MPRLKVHGSALSLDTWFKAIQIASFVTSAIAALQALLASEPTEPAPGEAEQPAKSEAAEAGAAEAGAAKVGAEPQMMLPAPSEGGPTPMSGAVTAAAGGASGGGQVEFEPTDEWQVVEEHHILPGGLHVRLDMSTGQKWAKISEK